MLLSSQRIVVKRHLCEELLPSEPFDPCGFGTDNVRMDDGFGD
jgi:hypothetical protein